MRLQLAAKHLQRFDRFRKKECFLGIGERDLRLAAVEPSEIVGDVFCARIAEDLGAQAQDVIEAGRVDGARTWHLFRYISVPLLRRIILFTTVLSTIGILQLFAEPYLLVGADGGTDYSLLTMMTYLYNNAFSYFKFGYASAIAYVMFVVIIIGSLLNLWIGRRNEE